MLLAASVYTFFFVPETKGLSLEQVDEMYRSGVKPWHSAQWQPTHGATRKGAFQRTLYASEQEAKDAEGSNADRARIEDAKARLAMQSQGQQKDAKLSDPEMIEHSAH